MTFWKALGALALLLSAPVHAATAPAAAPTGATDGPAAEIAPADPADAEVAAPLTDPVPEGDRNNTPDVTGADEKGPAVLAPQGMLPVDDLGMPAERGLGLQPQVTDVGRQAAFFHDIWLVPIMAAMTLLVLVLLLWVIMRYRRSANPVPSKTSHNTTIEVIWTIVPVLVLVVIAFPSLGLLARQYSPPKADLTVKAIGAQWYWNYEYPDHGVTLTSNMLREAGDPGVQPGTRVRTAADGPRLLAVDERVVVPLGATVKVIVTSEDVLHSFAMPAFWLKMDAVPGRLNETWFKADRPGVYFGQCSELCGARHAYMPIAIEVVPPARFAAWVASKGGTMPGGQPRRPDQTAGSPLTAPGSPTPDASVSAAEGGETSPDPVGVVDAIEKQPVSEQGTANSRRGGTN